MNKFFAFTITLLFFTGVMAGCSGNPETSEDAFDLGLEEALIELDLVE